MKFFSNSTTIALAALGGLVFPLKLQGAVVLNQIGDVNSYNFASGTNSSPSQIYADFPGFDCVVLEDFTVTSTELQISNVSALFQADGGFSRFGMVSGYALNFFSDPGLAATSLLGNIGTFVIPTGPRVSVSQVPSGGSSKEYGLVSLEVDFVMPAAGIYWVGVSPITVFSTTGQFQILHSGATALLPAGNANGKLANPGEGFGIGPISSLNFNYAYSVSVIPEPGVFTIFTMTTMGWLCWRRRTPQSSHGGNSCSSHM